MNTIRVSNSLDPGQALHDLLGPKCLPRFSADDTYRHVLGSRGEGLLLSILGSFLKGKVQTGRYF